MNKFAKRAGLNPYGAAPEKMHRVERRDASSGNVDNLWQGMWRTLGFERLLGILKESIEDRGC